MGPLHLDLMKAGLLPVGGNVAVENYLLPFIDAKVMTQGLSQAPLETKALMPWRSDPSLASKNLLLYFWFPGCANCQDGLKSLDSMKHAGKFPANVEIALIASDSDATQMVLDEMNEIGLRTPVFLDETGALAERLGVLAAPAVFLVDEDGLVAGRLNGDIYFDSPGFEILLKRLEGMGDAKTGTTLTSALASEVKHDSSPAVTFLNVPVRGVISIGILIVIWYCIWIISKRTTKNFQLFRRAKSSTVEKNGI